jgi:hypothetical protein
MLCRLRYLRRLRRLRPVGTGGTAATAGTASGGQPWFSGERWWSGIFLVVDMERRQTDVGEFFLSKKDFMLLRGR